VTSHTFSILKSTKDSNEDRIESRHGTQSKLPHHQNYRIEVPLLTGGFLPVLRSRGWRKKPHSSGNFLASANIYGRSGQLRENTKPVRQLAKNTPQACATGQVTGHDKASPKPGPALESGFFFDSGCSLFPRSTCFFLRSGRHSKNMHHSESRKDLQPPACLPRGGQGT